MKGLFLNHLDSKQEAYEHVKKGLRHDLTSSVCWHVYGLLYRSDKRYDDAVKCYKNATKYDQSNLQVMRDYAFMQLHLRDLDGFCDTMRQLLTLRGNQRIYWIGYAMSNVLRNELQVAVRILDAFEDSVSQVSDLPFEYGEFVMWKAHVIF